MFHHTRKATHLVVVVVVVRSAIGEPAPAAATAAAKTEPAKTEPAATAAEAAAGEAGLRRFGRRQAGLGGASPPCSTSPPPHDATDAPVAAAQ